MSSYFPRQNVSWKTEEPSSFRKLSLSLVEMAAITGVVLRLFRSLALTHSDSNSLLYLGGIYVLMYAFLFGMVTAHLGNYPVRRWLWRGPLFALVEVAAEMLTSFALIAAGREPLGSTRAELHDWSTIAQQTLQDRLLWIVLFVGLLAAMVQMIRYLLLRREHREGMAAAVQLDHERRTTGIPE